MARDLFPTGMPAGDGRNKKTLLPLVQKIIMKKKLWTPWDPEVPLHAGRPALFWWLVGPRAPQSVHP